MARAWRIEYVGYIESGYADLFDVAVMQLANLQIAEKFGLTYSA